MHDNTPCPRCQRSERVHYAILIRGPQPERVYRCGSCDHSWRVEDEQSAVAILHGGRVDDDVQQQAERVDQDMPFAAGDLLGRIKALRVKRGAPF